MDYAELLRANRNLRLVSRCQKALLRARTPEELSAAVCRAIAEEGHYPLAWTGTVVAGAKEGVLGSEMHGSAEGRAAAEAAGWQHGGDCRSGVALEALSDGAPCLRHGDPAEYCFPSALALPLRTGEAGSLPEGVLCVYASEEGAFDREEVVLLQRITDDVAYALEGMRAARKRRAAEQVLAYQANHDPVTGLANRTLFNDRLRQAVMAAERSGRKVAVLALTLDCYRGVKSSLGHEACNALLVHTASAMLSSLRDGDTVARLLGNEYAVIVPDMIDEEDILPVASRLLGAVKQPLRWQDRIVSTTVSIGVALAGKDGSDGASLLRSANAAMAHAVGLGGNRLRFYAHDMNERASRISAMEADLRRALARGELVLYYQPRASMGDASLVAVEALVRWQHPSRGLVAPGEFLSLAESSGLIVPLAAWVIREVCRQQRAWREAGLRLVPVAINLSPRQFREEGLAEHAEVALQMNDLAPSLLVFEVTEAAVMANVGDAVARLEELRAIGAGLSLDGLCTGQSSLARVRELPLDCLKISQSFVRKLGMEQADEAICRAIIDVGHSMGLRIVAEGVETLQQREWLRAHHCDEIQGYFYARPMPADALAKLLAADPARSTTMLPLWKAINYKG